MLRGAGYTFVYWFKTYLLILLLSSLFLFLLWLLGIEDHIDSMTEILNGPRNNGGITLLFLLSTLLLAPVFEELAFRQPLKDFQSNYLISTMAIIVLIGLSFFNRTSVGLLLLLLGIFYSINRHLLLSGHIQTDLSSKVIYILSMLFFVLAHFVSIETFDLSFWPVYVVYGTHMAVCAYYLSKIRLQKDIYYSMFLHFLYNLVPILVLVF